MNANYTEYVCFKQERAIFTLSGEPLKLVEKFTYLSSSVSSTESDINIRLAKAWAAIDALSIIYKSDLSDKIKCVNTIVWMHYMDANKTKCREKMLDGNDTRMPRAILNKIQKQHPTK